MATHSSILAWKIPWPEEPGGIVKNQTQLSMHTHTPFPTLPRPLPTGKLLELRQERLKDVIVDLVGGGVVPDIE